MLTYLRIKLKSYFSDTQRESLRNFIKSIRARAHQNNLTTLALLYGTDKASHGYTDIYPFYFNRIRQQKLTICEIGIGGTNNPQSGGGSLKMWTKYFPNSNIIGIDIFDKTFFNSKRIKTYQGHQADPIFLAYIKFIYQPFDIIIDDGSHINQDVINTFENLFPHVKSNGLYIIEDTQTSYWEEYGGNRLDLKAQNTTMNYFKQLVDSVNTIFIKTSEHPQLIQGIKFVHFYSNLIVIKKQ